jgi:cell division septum initiation protein DivIVA
MDDYVVKDNFNKELTNENKSLRKEVEDLKKKLKLFEEGEKTLITKIAKLEEMLELLTARCSKEKNKT